MDNGKLQSFPEYFRSEPSPRVLDSAFPPFKVEHKYRGVYERAGFDIYRGEKYKDTPKSVTVSTFSSGLDGTSRSGDRYRDFKSQENVYTKPTSYQQPGYSQKLTSKPLVHKPAQYYPGEAYNSSGPYENPIVINQYPVDSMDSNFVEPSPSDQRKNYMNLSLSLKDDSDNDNGFGSPYKEDTNETSVKGFSQSASVTDELLDTSIKTRNDSAVSPTKYSPVKARQLRQQRLSGAPDLNTELVSQKVPEILFSYQQNPYHSLGKTASGDFSSFQQMTHHDSNGLNIEYQQYLSGNDIRKSQMSMVSSIISKGSRYSDDEDVEAQRELERQLESLKMGTPVGAPPQDLPVNSSDPKDFKELKESDESEPDFNEPVDPQPYGTQPYPSQFPEDLDTPKPTPPLEQMPTITISDGFDPVQPLAVKNPYTYSFEEPVKLSRRSIEFKYPSGSGPCRTCKQKIVANAQGPQKAVYSKTGELTGQWHRQCFRCHHHQCQVTFQKNVQCYVLDDEAYCQYHYHHLNNSLCETCNRGIEGECIENELGQTWHRSCLKCVGCHQDITNDYYLINDMVYCENDALNAMNGGLGAMAKIEKRKTRLMQFPDLLQQQYP